MILRLQLDEVGNLRLARTAPRRPEVQEDDLALVRRELHVGAVHVLQREVQRRVLPDERRDRQRRPAVCAVGGRRRCIRVDDARSGIIISRTSAASTAPIASHAVFRLDRGGSARRQWRGLQRLRLGRRIRLFGCQSCCRLIRMTTGPRGGRMRRPASRSPAEAGETSTNVGRSARPDARSWPNVVTSAGSRVTPSSTKSDSVVPVHAVQQVRHAAVAVEAAAGADETDAVRAATTAARGYPSRIAPPAVSSTRVRIDGRRPSAETPGSTSCDRR